MPCRFGQYDSFDECVRKNSDKESPEGYCAKICKKITGKYPSEMSLRTALMIATEEGENIIPEKTSKTKKKKD